MKSEKRYTSWIGFEMRTFQVRTFLNCFGLMLIGILFSSGMALGNSNGMMGEETIGNKAINAANYKDWPEIMAVINNESRVYRSWVNGDERFYYETKPDQMNQLLVDFVKLKGKKEVLIVPQADEVETFDKKQSFQYNCQLHLVGGIAKMMAAKPKGDIYWPPHPRLTIYVTPTTDLKALAIPPKDVELVTLEEIKARYKTGLDSTDKSVRGWAIGFLVSADPFDGAMLKVVSDLTVDSDDWVALNALSNIGKFGPKVKDHLPRLKEIAKSPIKANAERAKKLIPEVEAASTKDAMSEFGKREKTFRAQADKAKAFVVRAREHHAEP